MCKPGRKGSNCVSFSAFFMFKFTGLPWDGLDNGGQVVARLERLDVPTGTEPRVWSVFSSGNHTGVILGYHDGQWIVGHAGCGRGHKGIAGPGDGTEGGGGSAFVQQISSMDSLWSRGSNLVFAYFDDRVDVDAISRYISSGE